MFALFTPAPPPSLSPSPHPTAGKTPFQRRNVAGGFQPYTGPFKPFKDGSKISINTDYWFSLASVGFPGYILAIISFVLFLLFALVRFCFCCCKRYCCPIPKEEGYSTMKKLVMIGAIGAFTVLVIAGAINVWVGGPETATEVSRLGKILVEQVTSIIDTISDLTNTLNKATELNDGGSTSNVADVQASLNDVKKTVGDVQKSIDGVLSQVKLYCIIAASVFAGYSVLAFILAGVFKQRWATVLFLVLMVRTKGAADERKHYPPS
jgi:hypothetical protein